MTLPAVSIPKEALPFLQRIFGPLAEVGDMVSEKIRFYRWKSSLETMQKAEQIAKERGYKVNEVPYKLLIPLLEKSSLEEEGSPLIDKWGSLLALASHDASAIKANYIDILSRIDASDAKLFDEIVSDEKLNSLEVTEEEGQPTMKFLVPRLSAHVGAVEGILLDFASCAATFDGTNFDELSPKFHAFLHDFVQKPVALAKLEECVVSFDRKIETRNIYYSSEGVLNPVNLDSLISAGLMERRLILQQAEVYRMRIGIVVPSVLGISFVRACRGRT